LTGEAIIDDKLNDNSDEEALILFDKFDVSNLDRTRIKKNTKREVIRISFLDLLLNE
jgi:hypothetical protein|tara:strand:- start:148 stop:318 length:171 start_codon:yes stop_codon:yes gene_type:complete